MSQELDQWNPVMRSMWQKELTKNRLVTHSKSIPMIGMEVEERNIFKRKEASTKIVGDTITVASISDKLNHKMNWNDQFLNLLKSCLLTLSYEMIRRHYRDEFFATLTKSNPSLDVLTKRIRQIEKQEWRRWLTIGLSKSENEVLKALPPALSMTELDWNLIQNVGTLSKYLKRRVSVGKASYSLEHCVNKTRHLFKLWRFLAMGSTCSF